MSDRAWTRHLRRALADMTAYDVPPAGADKARMHANECPEPWPPEVMRALAEVVAEVELNRYPDTSGRTLRTTLGRRYGVDPRRIILGNGSDEIISILLTALSDPSRQGVLVIPTPTFVMYEHSARVLGYEVRGVPLDARLELDDAALRDALRGATICFLARPNNPTSGLWDADQIRALVRDFPDVVFVVDEAYTAYAPGASMFDAQAPSNQVHMSTLSKVGLAALRLGYCVSDPQLAEALDKVRHPYNVSATSLALADAVLTRFDETRAAMVERVIAHRERLVNMLARLPGVEVFPAHGNLVLARFDPAPRAPALARDLAARGVLVKDVSRIPGLEGCLRVSVGTAIELDQLERGLAELA